MMPSVNPQSQNALEAKKQCEEFVETMMIPTLDEDVKLILEKLFKIISNVLTHPTEAKYRSIPTANKIVTDMLEKYPQSLKYLEILGFKELEADSENVKYVLKMGDEDPALLKTGLQILKVHLQNLDGPPSIEGETKNNFDASVATITRLGSGPIPSGKNFTLEEKAAALLKAREDLLVQAGIPDRDLKVFEEERIYKISKLPDTYGKRVDTEIIKQAAKQNSDKVRRSLRFQTKAMRDLEYLENTKVTTKIVIKVQFPDKLVIQANFSPLEHLADVEALVKNCMEPTVKANFYLFMRPINKPLDPNAKLAELKLGGGARLFVAWENGAPEGEYICDHLLESSRKDSQHSSSKIKRRSLFSRG